MSTIPLAITSVKRQRFSCSLANIVSGWIGANPGKWRWRHLGYIGGILEELEQHHQIAEIETAIIIDISSVMVVRPDTRSTKEEARKQGHIRVCNLPVPIDITTNKPRGIQVKKEAFALGQGQRIPNPQRSLPGTSAARSEKAQMLP